MAMTRTITRATTLTMALATFATAGCIGSPLGKPAVMRDMTSLPSDSDKQHEQSESALARPGEEKRKKLSKTAQAVETVAASAAVILGMFYSTSPNVLLGVETQFEENLVLDPTLGERERLSERRRKQAAKDKGKAADEDAAKPGAAAPKPKPANDPGQPVPWIHLAPAPAP
jgi:hypothetical protein